MNWTRMCLLLATVMLAATLLVDAASAQRPGRPDGARGGPPGPEMMIGRMDKDGDGKLNESEIPGTLWSRLKQADTDDDGAVSKEELAAHMKKRGTAERERSEGPPRTRSRGGEGGRPGGPPWARSGENERSESRGEAVRRGPGPRGPAASNEGPAAKMAEMLFGRLDKNQDGKISGDEVPEEGKERHAKADKDGDGAVTKEEFKQGVQARFQQRDPRARSAMRPGAGRSLQGGPPWMRGRAAFGRMHGMAMRRGFAAARSNAGRLQGSRGQGPMSHMSHGSGSPWGRGLPLHGRNAGGRYPGGPPWAAGHSAAGRLGSAPQRRGFGGPPWAGTASRFRAQPPHGGQSFAPGPWMNSRRGPQAIRGPSRRGSFGPNRFRGSSPRGFMHGPGGWHHRAEVEHEATPQVPTVAADESVSETADSLSDYVSGETAEVVAAE